MKQPKRAAYAGAVINILAMAGVFALAMGMAAFPCLGADESLTIGVGRDFYDGPDSRTFLHGSTNTWEALTYLGEGLVARPWLAESWESSEDAATWTFRLKKGVRFHDGTKLTALLAKASIDRIAAHARYDATGIYKNLDTLEARGKYELVFHLKAPSPGFANLVAYYASPILHPKTFVENGRLSGLVATGPFHVEEVKPGDRIVLKAFDGYWGNKPSYQTVVFRTLLDAQSRAMALMAGEVDAVADVGAILPQQIKAIQKEPGITLKQVEVATSHYLLFNCEKPPFNRADHRHWLAGLVNRQEMVTALVGGAGKVADDPFTPLATAYAFGGLKLRPGEKPATGMPKLTILLHAGTLERWPYRDMAQILQARLAMYGISAAIAVREPGAYYEDIQQGRFHMAMQPNTLMTGDPDFFYAYYVFSKGPRSCGCGSPEMDDLIYRGRHTVGPTARADIYRRLSQLFSETLPVLPLYHDISLYAHGPGVCDFAMDHNFRPDLLSARPAGEP